jgi:hypothetical protein
MAKDDGRMANLFLRHNPKKDKRKGLLERKKERTDSSFLQETPSFSLICIMQCYQPLKQSWEMHVSWASYGLKERYVGKKFAKLTNKIFLMGIIIILYRLKLSVTFYGR